MHWLSNAVASYDRVFFSYGRRKNYGGYALRLQETLT